MAELYDFGLVGLGVMGRNFILNVADHNFSSFGLDTDLEKVKALTQEGIGKKVSGTTDISTFAANLSRPRKIMLLVPAGGPVDAVINDLLPLLDEGDLIIDGGNSFFADTDRRFNELKEKGIHFMGSGVSGGAKGARFGPSIMPGGSKESYQLIKPIFEATSAKVNGEPCVDFMGNGSAGNYVKMVHNGIEYGLMQLIGEAYHILKVGMGLDNEALQATFSKWNDGKLKSFLVEITAEIFGEHDELTEGELVDQILDKAKQKGTGKWTSQNAMDLGVPVPTIDAAVSMRQLSSEKKSRVAADKLYGDLSIESGASITIEEVEDALYFAFIITYAQGMSQLKLASDEYGYELDMERISKIWRGGCIIRASLLEDMRTAYDNNDGLMSLLMDDQFAAQIKANIKQTRSVMSFAISHGIPVLAMGSSLSYFDAFKTSRLPLNLIQAQRDHFGSHTYERLDRPGIFHTDW